ncbi:AAA family ATPase [Flagellimonas halotolerans]|uniref:AAA family ATPase n=1 Tax=Flagellimonas halotolerans TaxID=3112164 RepID=A0ABU6IMT5_9FLAO|nr:MULTISPECIES: AAA family ATPase [unclassified Allomuricauda]MEC3964550.1 AAA family ATPase [Muricauda sp. SYSU M86414]MEC4264419.1 AAA family ATPase [Muricauda sp. SYSU M84420]
MIYKEFTIENFKGVDKVNVSLDKDELVLLLGLNESGKTTILKGIETFDYLNDLSKDYDNNFFRTIRKKSDVSSDTPAMITALIGLEEILEIKDYQGIFERGLLNKNKKDNVEAFFHFLNNEKKVKIQRVIPFKGGNPKQYYYQFISDHPFAEDQFSRILAKEMVHRCPFIIYFEDFKDRIPEKIFTSKTNDAFNVDWYDIIDGLFYNTDKEFSVANFKKLYSRSNRRERDAKTVLKRVNKTLNTSFSEKWKELSGVKDIEETELTYNIPKSYFEISITDTDGTTYAVDERSKGALWYLSFLMKTEFRRKKLRVNSGKPIFLIDEPASNLHSTAQQNMISDFKKLVEDTSVVYSTHSQYLISLDNIKTTYIIERNKGVVKSTLWSDYIKEDKSNETYYQPLANVLKIIPNSLTIPWNKAIITEGPSDRKVLSTMYKILFPEQIPDFVIYPGTSAQNLETLISFNLAWSADFRVMLDSDKEGKRAKEKYLKNFDLGEELVILLPIDNKKIEGYFNEDEKKELYKISFGKEKEERVNKKEFSSMFSILNSHPEKLDVASKAIGEETIFRFKGLFSALEITQN